MALWRAAAAFLSKQGKSARCVSNAVDGLPLSPSLYRTPVYPPAPAGCRQLYGKRISDPAVKIPGGLLNALSPTCSTPKVGHNTLLAVRQYSSCNPNGPLKDAFFSFCLALKKRLKLCKTKLNGLKDRAALMVQEFVMALKKFWAKQVLILHKGLKDKSVDIYFSCVLLVIYCLFCRAVEKVEKKLHRLESGDPNDSNLYKIAITLAIFAIEFVKYILVVFSDSEVAEVRREVKLQKCELGQLFKLIEVLEVENGELKDEIRKTKADLDALRKELKGKSSTEQ